MKEQEEQRAYLDISKSKFLEFVSRGRLPRPVKIDGIKSWDRFGNQTFLPIAQTRIGTHVLGVIVWALAHFVVGAAPVNAAVGTMTRSTALQSPNAATCQPNCNALTSARLHVLHAGGPSHNVIHAARQCALNCFEIFFCGRERTDRTKLFKIRFY